MIIDHIGLVVESITKGVTHWEKVFGYQQMTDFVTNSRQKVNVVFLKKEGSITIKLIEPVSETSPIYRFARQGGGLHHICFKCGSVDSEIKKMKEMGLHILANPQPGEAFDNENIAFLYAKQGLNIELIDTDKKSKKII